MSLNSLKTSDYRSLYDFRVDLHSLTILIGKNDAGKSNVLRAIELLLNEGATSKASKYDWCTVDKTRKATRYPRTITISGVVNSPNSTNVRRKVEVWNDRPSTSILEVQNSDGGWSIASFEDKKLLPMLYYLHPRTGALQEAFNSLIEHNILTLVKDWMPPELNNINALNKLMRNYASSSDAMSSYIAFFEKEVYGPLRLAFPPDFPLIRFDPKFRGDTDRNLLLVRELTHLQQQAIFRLPLDHHGSALISITAMVLAVAILQEYHKQEYGSRPLIIAIEEPEVHLSPGTQRTLLNYLRWVSERHQVLITTHSPILVDRAEPKNVIVLKRTNLKDQKEDASKKTGRKAGSTFAISSDYRKNWNGVIESLDVKLSDVLMSGEVNLLVEGPSEAIVLPAIGKALLKRSELSIDPDRIFVVHGEGKNLPNLVPILRRNGNPTIVMLDNDRDGNDMKQKIMKQETEAQKVKVEEIFLPSIETLRAPSNKLKECEFEDIFDSEILLNAFNKTFAHLPVFYYLPFKFEDFKQEQMRLFGQGKEFGWVATVNSLIDQKDPNTNRSKDRFSKPDLAETTAKYILDDLLPIPNYFVKIYRKIEEILVSAT